MMQSRLTDILNTAFQPSELSVLNESPGHAKNLGGESHFKVILVSQQFEGQPLLKRHRMVYDQLGQLVSSIHALSLHTYTPSEWILQKVEPQSPPCRRADLHEH